MVSTLPRVPRPGPSRYQSPSHPQQQQPQAAAEKDTILDYDEDDFGHNNSTTSSPERNTSLQGPPSPRYEVLSGSLVDAIASLAPRQYLSSTAVDLLVRAIPAGDD